MKRAAFLAILALPGTLIWPSAAAQSFPLRPVQLVVPASPGTAADQVARILSPLLAQRLNVPVVVDNKVGAGGSIAFDAVAKAPADGHTLLVATTAFSALPAIRPNLPYDPVKGFVPIVSLASSSLALAVSPGVPARSVHEFIEYARKQPAGRLSYASPGVGSIQHLTMELFKQKTGIHMLHVPYKATGNAINDVAAGHVQAAFVVLSTAATLAESGKLRLLAVIAERRNERFSHVPTLAEAGIRNMNATSWVSLLAPAGTPHEVVEKMNKEMNRLLSQADVRAAMATMGVEPGGGTARAVAEQIRRDLGVWSQVAKTAGIAPE